MTAGAFPHAQELDRDYFNPVGLLRQGRRFREAQRFTRDCTVADMGISDSDSKSPFSLDMTPLPSDWDDVYSMLDNIRSFMKEHPTHDLIPADDPGANYNPPRVARIGFSAFRTITPDFAAENVRRSARGEQVLEWDEQSKNWTITLVMLKQTLSLQTELAKSFKTAEGRRNLCFSLK